MNKFERIMLDILCIMVEIFPMPHLIYEKFFYPFVAECQRIISEMEQREEKEDAEIH